MAPAAGVSRGVVMHSCRRGEGGSEGSSEQQRRRHGVIQGFALVAAAGEVNDICDARSHAIYSLFPFSRGVGGPCCLGWGGVLSRPCRGRGEAAVEGSRVVVGRRSRWERPPSRPSKLQTSFHSCSHACCQRSWHTPKRTKHSAWPGRMPGPAAAAAADASPTAEHMQ